MIKIDVEGFEFPVLRGLERFFSGTACRPNIVCEIKPWELKKLGSTIEEFERYMTGFGYRSYLLSQEQRPVALTELKDMTVVLFRV